MSTSTPHTGTPDGASAPALASALSAEASASGAGPLSSSSSSSALPHRSLAATAANLSSPLDSVSGSATTFSPSPPTPPIARGGGARGASARGGAGDGTGSSPSASSVASFHTASDIASLGDAPWTDKLVAALKAAEPSSFKGKFFTRLSADDWGEVIQRNLDHLPGADANNVDELAFRAFRLLTSPSSPFLAAPAPPQPTAAAAAATLSTPTHAVAAVKAPQAIDLRAAIKSTIGVSMTGAAPLLYSLAVDKGLEALKASVAGGSALLLIITNLAQLIAAVALLEATRSRSGTILQKNSNATNPFVPLRKDFFTSDSSALLQAVLKCGGHIPDEFPLDNFLTSACAYIAQHSTFDDFFKVIGGGTAQPRLDGAKQDYACSTASASVDSIVRVLETLETAGLSWLIHQWEDEPEPANSTTPFGKAIDATPAACEPRSAIGRLVHVVTAWALNYNPHDYYFSRKLTPFFMSWNKYTKALAGSSRASMTLSTSTFISPASAAASASASAAAPLSPRHTFLSTVAALVTQGDGPSSDGDDASELSIRLATIATTISHPFTLRNALHHAAQVLRHRTLHPSLTQPTASTFFNLTNIVTVDTPPAAPTSYAAAARPSAGAGKAAPTSAAPASAASSSDSAAFTALAAAATALSATSLSSTAPHSTATVATAATSRGPRDNSTDYNGIPILAEHQAFKGKFFIYYKDCPDQKKGDPCRPVHKYNEGVKGPAIPGTCVHAFHTIGGRSVFTGDGKTPLPTRSA